MAGGRVDVDLRGLKQFESEVREGLRDGVGPIRDAFTQWQARYVAFLRERFVKNSRSNWPWPPLAQSTIHRRRHGKGGRFKRGKRAYEKALASGGGQVAILRDTGTLLAALDVRWDGAPGKLNEIIPYGVRVGFGGPARHPEGDATIADIARFHQEGRGRLPQREIIVDPPGDLLRQMADDIHRAIERIINGG